MMIWKKLIIKIIQSKSKVGRMVVNTSGLYACDVRFIIGFTDFGFVSFRINLIYICT